VSGDEQAAALADDLQADYFRGCLKRQRSLLAGELAKHVNDLTRATTTGATHTVSHIRRSIRQADNDIRAIDRMIQALDRRFPEQTVTQ
jgi:hypothetical protein